MYKRIWGKKHAKRDLRVVTKQKDGQGILKGVGEQCTWNKPEEGDSGDGQAENFLVPYGMPC